MIRVLFLLVVFCWGLDAQMAAAQMRRPSRRPPVIMAPVQTENWWHDAVFYGVYLPGFQDSDGDGVGDFSGLIQKLDDLNDGDPKTHKDLGVTGLWLMSVTAVKGDQGYEVMDSRHLNPIFRDRNGFLDLVAEAGKRNIAIIVDLNLTHCSQAHPWFQEALFSPDSKKKAWFTFRDQDPGWLGPGGQPVWHEVGDRYVFGAVQRGMPDFRLQDPEVRHALLDIAQFWLEEMMVDGFRVKPIRYLVEKDGMQVDASSTHAWLREFHDNIQQLNPASMTLVDLPWEAQEVAACVREHEASMGLDVGLAKAIADSVGTDDPAPLKAQLGKMAQAYQPGGFASFLSAPDQARVMTQMGGNTRRAALAASLLLTLPGTPFILCGEEIGMEGVALDAERCISDPWPPSRGGTGTTGQSVRSSRDDTMEIDPEEPRNDTKSLWNTYRRLIQLRSREVALRRGELQEIQCSRRQVMAFLRSWPGQDADTCLVVANFSDEPIQGLMVAAVHSRLGPGPRRWAQIYPHRKVSGVLTVGESGNFGLIQLPQVFPAHGLCVMKIH